MIRIIGTNIKFLSFNYHNALQNLYHDKHGESSDSDSSPRYDSDTDHSIKSKDVDNGWVRVSEDGSFLKHSTAIKPNYMHHVNVSIWVSKTLVLPSID